MYVCEGGRYVCESDRGVCEREMKRRVKTRCGAAAVLSQVCVCVCYGGVCVCERDTERVVV